MSRRPRPHRRPRPGHALRTRSIRRLARISRRSLNAPASPVRGPKTERHLPWPTTGHRPQQPCPQRRRLENFLGTPPRFVREGLPLVPGRVEGRGSGSAPLPHANLPQPSAKSFLPHEHGLSNASPTGRQSNNGSAKRRDDEGSKDGCLLTSQVRLILSSGEDHQARAAALHPLAHLGRFGQERSRQAASRSG